MRPFLAVSTALITFHYKIIDKLPSFLYYKTKDRIIDLIPLGIGLALGTYCSPTLRYAVVANTANFILQNILSCFVRPFWPKEEIIVDHPVCIVMEPLLEEIWFRGIAQNVLTWTTGSAIVGGTVSASLFGAMHLVYGSRNQAIFATITGLTLGFLNHNWGITAAVVGHITQNFLAAGLLHICNHRVRKQVQDLY